MASMARDNSESRTIGFLLLSSLFHTALVVAVFTISFEARKMVEVTEVEFIDSKPASPVPVTQAPEPSVKEVVQQAPVSAPEPAPVTIAKAKKAQTPKVTSLPAAPKKAVVAEAKSQSQPESVQQESPVVIPVLETADLSQEDTVSAEPVAELKEEDISDDLSKVDEEQNTKVMALQDQLNKDTEKDIQEQDQKFAALQKESADEASKLAAENAEKRAQERAELQAALAAQAAADAKAAQNSGGGNSAGEVRALEDLKQVSGNKKPYYDSDDRLHGRQGEVAFLAYVSKQGAITQFKMIKSSGHRQLDAKTLKAIRDWKFYPGQEGWVEIPFRWDLKGGPQEMPATLRRAKVSSSY